MSWALLWLGCAPPVVCGVECEASAELVYGYEVCASGAENRVSAEPVSFTPTTCQEVSESKRGYTDCEVDSDCAGERYCRFHSGGGPVNPPYCSCHDPVCETDADCLESEACYKNGDCIPASCHTNQDCPCGQCRVVETAHYFDKVSYTYSLACRNK